MHTAKKVYLYYIYITMSFPQCLSHNAWILLARVVDGGPTLTQHCSFVKDESLVY